MTDKLTFTVGRSHLQSKPEQFGKITYQVLVDIALSPRDLSQHAELDSKTIKSMCWWFIPSSCAHKTKMEMMAHGEYCLLVADLDEGNRKPEDISKILEATGIESYLIYDTVSSQLEDRRLRVVIPLTESCGVSEWADLQNALTEVIGDADDCTTRAQQISYMPTLTKNNLVCFEVRVGDGPKLNPFSSGFAIKAKQLAEQSALENCNIAENKPTEVITKPMVEEDGTLNPLVVFNESWDWSSLLSHCGFKKRGKRWLPPCSSSGVAGAVISYRDNLQGAYLSPHSSDPLNYIDWKPSDKLDVWLVHGLGMDHRDPISTAIALKKFSEEHIVKGGITLQKYNQIQHAKNVEKTLDAIVSITLPDELI